MISTLFLSAALALPARAASSEAPRGAHMLNLSCVEALVAISQPGLAGVFSFVSEKDSSAAFADLVVHDKKALKKYVAKLEADRKDAGGIATWDHEAVAFALSIYASPLAETLEKPGALAARLGDLAAAPVMQLSELTARRRKR